MNELPIREYRRLLTSAGQASPPHLGRRVADLLRKKFAGARTLSVVDVGCGLGHQMRRISSALPGAFATIHGIDWSPATVEMHASDPASIYNHVSLCDSSRLPYERGTFDIALSMENLEHLYADYSIGAISELARIAKHVLITTPLPWDCINVRWLFEEMTDAILDPIPLSRRDFVCLESAVHKSTLFPRSMRDAGFELHGRLNAIYFGRSDSIRIENVRCLGIPEDVASDAEISNYRDRYLRLLANSAALRKSIVAHPLYQGPRLRDRLEILTKSQVHKALAARRAPLVS